MSKKDIPAKETEELEASPIDRLLEKAEEVKTISPEGGAKPVISLGLDLETLKELEIYAREIGEKPTVVAREFIREGLQNRGKKLSSENLLDIAKLRIKAERSELLVRLSESVDSPSVKGKTVARSSEKAKLAKRTKAADKKA